MEHVAVGDREMNDRRGAVIWKTIPLKRLWNAICCRWRMFHRLGRLEGVYQMTQRIEKKGGCEEENGQREEEGSGLRETVSCRRSEGSSEWKRVEARVARLGRYSPKGNQYQISPEKYHLVWYPAGLSSVM